jgi:hypothetical protein
MEVRDADGRSVIEITADSDITFFQSYVTLGLMLYLCQDSSGT